MSSNDSLRQCIADFWLTWNAFDWTTDTRHSWKDVLEYWTRQLQCLQDKLDRFRHWFSWYRRQNGKTPFSFTAASDQHKWATGNILDIDDYLQRQPLKMSTTLQLELIRLAATLGHKDDFTDLDFLHLYLRCFLHLPPQTWHFDKWLNDMENMEAISVATCRNGTHLDLDWLFLDWFSNYPTTRFTQDFFEWLPFGYTHIYSLHIFYILSQLFTDLALFFSALHNATLDLT